jgi:hypothetical protein
MGESPRLHSTAVPLASLEVPASGEDREFMYADASHELTPGERLFLAIAVVLAAVAAGGSVFYIARFLYVAVRATTAAI